MASDADLVRRLAERLEPDDADALADQLRRSQAFAGDLTWLEHLFAAADDLPLPEVPEAVTSSLLSIFTPTPPAVRNEECVVIHDSRSARPLAGVRGHEPLPEGAWTTVFSAPSADLIIDGTPLRDGRTVLRGHLLFRDGEQTDFSIDVGDGEPHHSDSSGRFELDPVAAGTHHFSIETRRFRLPFDIAITS